MFLSPPFKLSAKRIISLVPSQTELLHDLGVGNNLIGITKFCIHPKAWFTSKTRIGGTKTLDLERIKSLEPDLIIANKEENVKEQVNELASIYPVWVTNVNSLEDALQMIHDAGVITETSVKAEEIVNIIKNNFLELENSLNGKIHTGAYLIWKDPYMTVGGDCFISDMMKRAGFENVFANQERYPVVTLQDIADSTAEYVLLSSEPFPFKAQHAKALQKELPGKKIILVDGEMFSWYGSRLMHATAYFEKLALSLKL